MSDRLGRPAHRDAGSGSPGRRSARAPRASVVVELVAGIGDAERGMARRATISSSRATTRRAGGRPSTRPGSGTRLRAQPLGVGTHAMASLREDASRTLPVSVVACVGCARSGLAAILAAPTTGASGLTQAGVLPQWHLADPFGSGVLRWRNSRSGRVCSALATGACPISAVNGHVLAPEIPACETLPQTLPQPCSAGARTCAQGVVGI